METKPEQRTSSDKNENLLNDASRAIPSGNKQRSGYEAKQGTKKIEILKEVREWITLIFAMVAVYFTYQIMCETRRQADASIGAVNIADKSIAITKQSVEVSKISADAAMKSAISAESSNTIAKIGIDLTKNSFDFTRQSARLELKPYLVIDTGLIVTFNKVGDSIVIDIPIKNIGKTPALTAKVFDGFVWKIRDSFIERSNMSPRPTPQNFTIQPSERYIMRTFATTKITSSDSIGIWNYWRQISFYGYIIFDDVFSIRDTFPFCFNYDFITKDFEACEK